MDYGFDYNEPQNDNNQAPKKKKNKALLVIGIILISIAGILTASFLFNLTTEVLFGIIDIMEDPIGINVSIRDVDTDEMMTVPQTVAKVENSVVAIGYNEACGNGSGVIISEDGYIVTNHHVISGGDTIFVELSNGSVYPATVWASDAQSDIGIIKIEAQQTLIPATFGDSSKILKGEDVIVIGNPTGDFKGSVSSGIISHNNRTVNIEGYIMNVIQTDASVNPGNSGGGLFNLYGELIGIVNAKMVATTVESIGFAIPSNTALAIIEDLLEYGYVTGRPHLGLSMDVMRRVTANGFAYDYIVTESRYCEDIKVGDKILTVGGKNLGEYTSQELLYGYEIGDEIEVVLVRDSKTIVITVVLQEYTPN